MLGVAVASRVRRPVRYARFHGEFGSITGRRVHAKKTTRLTHCRSRTCLPRGGICQSSIKVLGHKDLVVVAAVLLKSLFLDSIFEETEIGIQPTRLFIVADHHQFDALASKIDDGLSQPSADATVSYVGADVHAPKHAFVSLLQALLDKESSNAQ